MLLSRLRRFLLLLAMLAGGLANASAAFPLVANGRAAPLVVSPDDARVVHLAAADLARDIASITGIAPPLVGAVVPNRPSPLDATAPRVLLGTLGHAAEIDALVASGALDIGNLRGAWESFLIATLAPPAVPAPTLVIVGSDRRGTAFGIYELSQQIGVSPWHWWADSTPEKKSELVIPDGTRRFGPPSVKYRGIFLNDEDWGLQPWAATTFEPENGGIGPKTYAKVFELLLRLKANTLWPAMHACTKPFNANPSNAALADDYAIVMGSSHAEPMLRNNVREWPHDRPKDYNYVTNRDGVRAYWEERVRTNGRYENLWTLGMRGIHDSAIQGAKTDAERIAVLEQVFADQRAMLAQHVPVDSAPVGAVAPNRPVTTAADITRTPQIFCAYKEVLDLYRGGLRVPDDVTIVWPDDNFGYVRNFATPEERQRAGGFGVYYHISYLGRPLAYLWLCTTPPALIWEEMTKSYAHGADRVWIVNVGDLKPAEIGTEFFLRLAWDVKQWGPDAQPKFLREFAAREFGVEHADDIAEILGEFYRLNFERKPEHLQWWLPERKNDPTNAPAGTSRFSDFTDDEVDARLADFRRLVQRVDRVGSRLSATQQEAFFQLVSYPALGASLANQRYFAGERGEISTARGYDIQLRKLNVLYDEIAGGKWRGFMRLEPADDDWKSMRIAAWTPPSAPRPSLAAPPGRLFIDASQAQQISNAHAVTGLGRSGEAMVMNPRAMITFEVDLLAGEFDLSLELLPTHSITEDTHRATVTIDDGPALKLHLPIGDGRHAWAQGVLAGYRPLTTLVRFETARRHRLTVSEASAGLVLDRIVFTPAPR
jgi:hypothetical protein